MLSPELHDEFGVPYLNRLSDAFGGIYVHSCGDWTHLFPSLEKVRGLRGLEFGASEAPYDKVLARFGGKTVLACRIGLHRDIRFAGMADFVRKIIAAAPTPRGLFVHVDITNGLVARLARNRPRRDLCSFRRREPGLAKVSGAGASTPILAVTGWRLLGGQEHCRRSRERRSGGDMYLWYVSPALNAGLHSTSGPRGREDRAPRRPGGHPARPGRSRSSRRARPRPARRPWSFPSRPGPCAWP